MALNTGVRIVRLSGVFGLGNADGPDTTRFERSGTAGDSALLERKEVPGGGPTIVFERGRDVTAGIDIAEVAKDDEDADEAKEDAEDTEAIRCSTGAEVGVAALAAISFVWRLFTFRVKDSTLLFRLLLSFINLKCGSST